MEMMNERKNGIDPKVVNEHEDIFCVTIYCTNGAQHLHGVTKIANGQTSAHWLPNELGRATPNRIYVSESRLIFLGITTSNMC